MQVEIHTTISGVEYETHEQLCERWFQFGSSSRRVLAAGTLNVLADEPTDVRVADGTAIHNRAETSPSPQSPDRERTRFQLADPQLTIDLVACEPAVQSPVAISWDVRGRMFVAEMIGYPETAGQGRISRLEDRDHDGHYETASVFADGLDFPTSVMPIAGGVLVAAAPDIIYFADHNDDGRADHQMTLLTGFGVGSQQLRANGLHYAIDGWIYGANGHCDGEVRRPEQPPDQAISIRGKDFRFRLPCQLLDKTRRDASGTSGFGLRSDPGSIFNSVKATIGAQISLLEHDPCATSAVRIARGLWHFGRFDEPSSTPPSQKTPGTCRCRSSSAAVEHRTIQLYDRDDLVGGGSSGEALSATHSCE